MTDCFNSYMDAPEMDYWRRLCIEEGELITYAKGEEFCRVDEVARYVGFVKSGTLKYLIYGEDGSEHVVGLEFAGEFVADYPFSLRGIKSRVSIMADSECEIYCYPVKALVERLHSDSSFERLMLYISELLFMQIYHRYMALYCKSPQERYRELLSKHPDLFSLFSLKDIASFLNISPTHLSRLRKIM